MAGNLAANARDHDECLQSNRSAFGSNGLVEERKDGNTGRGSDQVIDVLHAEKECNSVGPGRDETNGNGTHDCNWDHLLGSVDLLGQVSCTVEAGKGPVGVDEPNDESFSSVSWVPL